MRINTSLIRFDLPLAALAVCFATVPAATTREQSTKGSSNESGQIHRVVAKAHLTGTTEAQQIVTRQLRGDAQLVIETPDPRPRVLLQMVSRDSGSRVDSVRIADLDEDGLPEILSLWWKDSSPGAMLRVVHWDRSQGSFVELHFENDKARVYSYRVVRANGSNRLAVDSRPDRSAEQYASRGDLYELRGSTFVRAGGGGRVVTPTEDSGIEGQAVISPAHPGPIREGIPDTAPYKTTLVVWRSDGDQEIARVETGSDGHFRVAIPPGTYRIGPAKTARALPRGGEETVTVVAGKFARVTISFDSGMR
jgi:hypothetical protein